MLKGDFNDYMVNSALYDYKNDWTLAVAERIQDINNANQFRVVFSSLGVKTGAADPMYVPNEAFSAGAFNKASANADGG